jgi:flavin reductase (DIM6/NTAB) family NADH-FMN oxidoreductase RutF
VITATHPEHGALGITANSFTSVSLDPPLVLFSLARSARSLGAMLDTAGFAVNVLRESQSALSHRFARTGEDKWHDVRWTPSAHGAPRLDGALAVFECAHHARHDGGDHVIVVGRVVAFHADAHAAPLLYFGSRYRALAEAEAREFVP